MCEAWCSAVLQPMPALQALLLLFKTNPRMLVRSQDSWMETFACPEGPNLLCSCNAHTLTV